MKRAFLMISVSLFPRLLGAQGLEVSDLVGEHWYGLYFGGEKVGYAMSSVEVAESGEVTVRENAQFKITMFGVQQEMRTAGRRVYAPNGDLKAFEQEVVDPLGPKQFNGRVVGDALVLNSSVGGLESEETFPKPKESLADALEQIELLGDGADVGDEVSFALFDAVMKREISGVSRIMHIETRVFEGVATKVFRIETSLDLGINTVSYVAEDGTTLEDVIAGMLTMRLEPEAIAKDIDYGNDVIISSAVRLDAPIEDPRERGELRLLLKGPLNEDHLFNDERQVIRPAPEGYEFVGKKISLEGFEATQLPIQDEDVTEWLKPSTFVQSDRPELIEKAKEIVGEERDAAAVSQRLCTWVRDNMRTSYSAQLSNALEVLNNMEGDCTEHSILFIGLARAAGLPAREVAGLVYTGGPDAAFYYHQWAKVWIGKWIDVDPTFGEPLADATHIKLAEGDLYEMAKLIPIIGQIKIEAAE
ncbi:MAG TPA: transglutaminase domain-containing protein [Candidatus Hydrogenedentes bacterium]|nr:transglutaminase domain-containing protein [Candidatus Hydrogenedentota bacterium]